jgi:hypothetical protein
MAAHRTTTLDVNVYCIPGNFQNNRSKHVVHRHSKFWAPGVHPEFNAGSGFHGIFRKNNLGMPDTNTQDWGSFYSCLQFWHLLSLEGGV